MLLRLLCGIRHGWAGPLVLACYENGRNRVFHRRACRHAVPAAAWQVGNLAYMSRLGLWGPGAAFPSFEVPACCRGWGPGSGGRAAWTCQRRCAVAASPALHSLHPRLQAFLASMKKRGITFLEMLSMELKGDGLYVSRGLSFRCAAPALAARPPCTWRPLRPCWWRHRGRAAHGACRRKPVISPAAVHVPCLLAPPQGGRVFGAGVPADGAADCGVRCRGVCVAGAAGVTCAGCGG